MAKRIARYVAIWAALVAMLTGCAAGTGSQPAPAPSAPAPQAQAPAAAAAPKAQDPLQALYEKAKQEGEVVTWGGIGPEEVGVLAEAFNKRFPGIKVNHTEIRPDDFVTRVVAEAQQGRISLDVGAGRMGALGALIERDLLQGYSDWKQLFPDFVESGVAANGRFVAYYHLIFPIAYNTNLVKPADVPTSWDDLLDPKWKSKIMAEPRGNAFGYLGIEWGEQKVVDYVNKLMKQDLLFVKGGNQVSLQLAAGARAVAIGGNTHQILQDKAKGAPIEWAKKVSPTGAGTTSLAIMKGAKHPNAAKLWVAWLGTEEAQKLNEAKHFRGVVTPGSPYTVSKDYEANKIKLVAETFENWKEADRINAAAAKALGTLQ